jgi:uptake hydrogenase large subunit
MSRLIVGPFNRVEGDLEVRLDIAHGVVERAEVVAPMYRGFEAMLLGRSPRDALTIVPRICGICSVSQSIAAARALADAAGVVPPPNGLHVLNLMLGIENAADHLSHFYLFFMPDFARPVYAGRPWFGEVQRRFTALGGEQTRRAIAARQRWFELMGTLGGRWPHTHSVLPGGSARAIEAAERSRLQGRVREFRRWLEGDLFASPLEQVVGLQSLAQLESWHAAEPNRGDARLWLTVAADLGLDRAGPGPGRLLSYGSLQPPGGAAAAARGLWLAGEQRLQALDTAAIGEDSTHAWLVSDTADGGSPLRHPQAGFTAPDPDKPGAYTWCKAPRLAGQVIETGALARQAVDGQALIRDTLARHGSTVAGRVLGRLIDLARTVLLVESTLAAVVPREPFHVADELPADADAAGVGLTEAARGALGHWVRVERGRIAGYQIVAPTSWNFSPRDASGQPGALEAALVGAPVAAGEATPVSVQHIVRSFDPCMVCTVH